MKRKRTPRSYGVGQLPAAAPLANPYVPFQQEDPPKYEARFGLVRGTLYPGLDLPFQGRVNQKELNMTPGTELQAFQFAIQELALYLDTHRGDAEALEAYRTYQKLYQQMKAQYQQSHGPLTHMCPDDSDGYGWLNDPWPWEYSHNKGV